MHKTILCRAVPARALFYNAEFRGTAEFKKIITLLFKGEFRDSAVHVRDRDRSNRNNAWAGGAGRRYILEI